MLILAWIFLMRLSHSLPVNALTRISPQTSYYFIAPYFCVFFLVYPIVGLLADVKFGKFKVALASASFVLVVALLLLLISIVIVVGKHNLAIIKLNKINVVGFLLSVGNTLNISGIMCFELSMTSLALDQLVNTSTTFLKAFVWWHSWIHLMDLLIRDTGTCFLYHSMRHAVFFPVGLHIVCIAVVVVTSIMSRNIFRKDTPTVNPLRLIASVLNYARKNHYPRNRSALTYWLDDYPPRIDLGKTKYGGPFTEEEVENVKTFFRLLPVVLVTLMSFAQPVDLGHTHFSVNGTKQNIGECLLMSHFTHFGIAVVFIPIKILVLDRFCYKMKCFSTIFRMIGIGIFITLCAKAILPVIDFFAVSSNNGTAVCLYTNDWPHNITTIVEYFKVDYCFLIIPQVFSGLGTVLVLPASFEFLLAQTPLEMRGIIVGLYYSVTGLYQQFVSFSLLPFKSFSFWPSCEFYFYILNVAVLLVSLVGVIIISKWYKLRQRDDPYNVYATVEDIYERDLERRDNFQYMYGTLE